MPPVLLVMAVDMQWSTIWVIYHSYKIHTRRHKEDKKCSVIHLMYSWMCLRVGLHLPSKQLLLRLRHRDAQ